MIGHAWRHAVPLEGRETPDGRLFETFRDSGEEAALEELVARHWEPCFRVALGLLRDPAGAEDAAQRALVRLVDAARRKRAIESVGGWLRSAVVTEARNLRRGEKRRSEHHARHQAGALRAGGAEDPVAAVREHVEALPEKLREPLVLHFGLGLTHAEVAAALGAPVGTVSSWIKSGLEQLRRQPVGGPALAIEVLLVTALAGATAPVVPAAPTARSLVARAPAPLRLPAKGTVALGAAALAMAAVLALVVPRLASSLEDAPKDHAALAGAPAGDSAPVASALVAVPPAPDDVRAAPSELPNVSAATVGSSAAPAPGQAAPVASAVIGRVVDEDGRPVAGALVHLSRDRRLPDLPGAWTHDDLATAKMLASLPLEQGAARESTTYYSTRSEDAGETRSGEDGRFRIPLGALRLTSKTSLALAVGIDLQGGRAVGWADVPGKRASELDAGDVKVALPSFVPVLVRAAGAPVQGALVTLESSFRHGGAHRFSYFTDRDGTLSLPVLPGAKARQVRVAKEGYASQVKHAPLPGPDGLLAFDLEPECVIRGIVLDDKGQPAAGLRVETCLAGFDGDGYPRLEASVAETGADGRFATGGLATGSEYSVAVDPSHSDTAHWGNEVQATAPSNDVVLRLRPTAQIELDILLPDGFVPTQDWLDGVTVVTESDGAVSFHDGLALVAPGRARATLKEGSGTYRFSIVDFGEPSRPRLAPVVTNPIVGTEGVVTHVELTASLGRAIKGRVLDELHAPVARPDLLFELPGCMEALSGEDDGTFETGGMPRDSFEIGIEKSGDDRVRVRITVPAGVGTLPDVILPGR
jgi:RNA polymerase sigma-70 factor (ECF subfamily)